MNKVQTDNDVAMWAVKIELRDKLVQEKDHYRILEAFAGDGALWAEMRKRYPGKTFDILRIDAKPDKKGVYLKGDNLKFMASIDLSTFDIIDLDAYGSPFHQLELVFASGFRGPVVCTAIQTMSGALPTSFLKTLGYTQYMVKKCPTLFNAGGFDKMKEYLARKGVKKLAYFSQNRKNYFSFHITD